MKIKVLRCYTKNTECRSCYDNFYSWLIDCDTPWTEVTQEQFEEIKDYIKYKPEYLLIYEPNKKEENPIPFTLDTLFKEIETLKKKILIEKEIQEKRAKTREKRQREKEKAKAAELLKKFPELLKASSTK